MKRFVTMFVCCAMLVGVLAACNNDGTVDDTVSDNTVEMG